LILVDDTLFGTTEGGGISNSGTIFAINTDGSGYTNLYSFSELDTNLDNSDGANPSASLVFAGNMVYGTTQAGGTYGAGTVFGLTTNGSFFTNLYSFTGGNDGGFPQAGLTLSNGVLYGTALNGGLDFRGTIFAINTNSTGFTNLYNFMGRNDGGFPAANLVLSDGWLYGTTAYGGSNFLGNVFGLSMDGSVFTNLYEFTGGDDGSGPASGLILMGDMLYGTAAYGGTSSNGTVYAVNTNGSAFTNLHIFSALNTNFDNGDGGTPEAGLASSGSELFGTARYGGLNDSGTVFGVSTNGETFSTLMSFNPSVNGFEFDANSDGASPQGGVVLSGDALFGTANQGGAWGNGTIFSMETNGSNFATLYSFSGQNDGGMPAAGLTLSGNTLYGAAEYGGLGFGAGYGVLYSIETNGSDFTVIYTFSLLDTNFENGDGANPVASLLFANNVLYGTTTAGGGSGNGTIFAVTTDGLHFTNLHSFPALNGSGENSDGAKPVAGLVMSNNVLYGTAPKGGAAGFGTVFALPADGSGFTNLYSFTNGSDGATPLAPLYLTNGMLYGTAEYGGAGNNGTIFGMNLDGSGFTILHAFTGRGDGGNPMGGLVGDRVYVPLANGGSNFFTGAIFSLNLYGSGPVGTSLPGGTEGSYPIGEMGVTAGGTVFAAAGQGGAANEGAIIAVTQAPSTVEATLESSSGNVNIPDGGIGNINVPVATSFDYTFYLNSNINPNSISVATGLLPSGLNVSQNGTTGAWSITGDFAEAGTYTATLEVQDGVTAYFYTLNFNVCNLPTITNVVAGNTNAQIEAGSQIIITGAGLSSATQVLFNDATLGDSNAVPAANIQIDSDNQLTVTVPTGAETAPIAVITPCGNYVTTPAVVIGSPPAITLSSPALMPGNVLSFALSGPSGTYQILSSTDLVHWTPLFTVLLDNDAPSKQDIKMVSVPPFDGDIIGYFVYLAGF
jgi:uncharacterized repeat protein (TIGR03803 family)